MFQDRNVNTFNLMFKDVGFKLAITLAIVLLLIQITAIFYYSGNEAGQILFGNTFNLVVDGFAIILIFYAFFKARSFRKASSTAWGILGIATVIWFIADLAWGIIEVYLGQDPFPSIADVFYLAYYPLFAIGILLFPRERFSTEGRLKFIIDMLVITLAAGLIFWIFLVSPTVAAYSESPFIEMVASLGYVLGDFILLFAVFSLLFAGFKELSQNAVIFLLMGIFIAIISDSIYTIQSLQGTYVSGGFLDIGWLMQSIFIGLAAITQVTEWKNMDSTVSESWTKYKVKFLSYLPILLVVLSYGMLVWTYYIDKANFEIAMIANAFIIGLVLIRQALSVSEKMETAKGVFESSPDAVLITNLQGEIIDINPAALDMYGFSSKNEMVNQNMFNLIQKEDRIEAAKNMERIIRDGVLRDVEFTLLKRDGERFPANISIGIIPDLAGKPTTMMATVKDITQRKKTENEVKKSLREKERLLREIHHRVKNNLQVVVSLLSLQSDFVGEKEASEILRDSEVKVQSMAMVHKLLYQTTDISRLDFMEYLKKLTSNILDTYPIHENILLNLNAQDIHLDADTAIPCGLIITELLTNSLKYAFNEGDQGSITINMERKDDEYILTVADDGIGVPDDLENISGDGVGLNLVNSLVLQLEGTLKLDNSKGTKFIIEFPAGD
ncbi:sensor histidine kinase [Methanobacterium oryzae]|uniref:sensor histidine kinase n=1 Tax=Methanobacterium oryzae TaxID=69540 RepID=UPI003D24F2B5